MSKQSALPILHEKPLWITARRGRPIPSQSVPSIPIPSRAANPMPAGTYVVHSRCASRMAMARLAMRAIAITRLSTALNLLRPLQLVIPLTFLLAACGASGADKNRDVASLDSGKSEIGDNTETASELSAHDTLGDGLQTPDLDQLETIPSCQDGIRSCDGELLVVCLNGKLELALNCAEEGWNCLGGDCLTTQPETTTKAKWRKRLVELSVHNALTPPFEFDSYGGWKNSPPSLGKGLTGDYFTVQKLNGRWWFVTPEGNIFLSKGVTDVNFLGANLASDRHHALLLEKYGSEAAWVEESVNRLHKWGYNTVGPWSGLSMMKALPHAGIILDSGGWAPRYEGAVVTDFWSPGFAENCAKKALERAAPHVEDKRLLGHFLDNELAWEPNWTTNLTLLQNYMDFPSDAPGRAEAVNFLQGRLESVEEFNLVWGTALASLSDVESLTSEELAPTSEAGNQISKEFAVKAFAKYASTAVAALREVDPNHLVMGCRFHTYHWDELVIEAAKHFDVISLAYYWDTPPVADVDRVSALVDKPFLLEEFSFKAEDSGYLNVMNFAPVVETQKDRALAYDAYVLDWMSRPYAVAYHWYKWFDNPTKEDNILAGDNFGLLTPADDPYLPFVTLARAVNLSVESLHAK